MYQDIPDSSCIKTSMTLRLFSVAVLEAGSS